MAEYIIYESTLKPSPIKGELPDVNYEYVANESAIGWHYTFTNDRKKAYIFDDFQTEQAKEIAQLLQMQLKQID